MSSAKEQTEATNSLSFLQQPRISFSENEEKVYDLQLKNNFSHFNDSNSDDTQFESQSGELNSNDTSPVKEKTVLERSPHTEKTEGNNKYIEQDCVPSDQEPVDEKTLQPGKSNHLNNADATSFVDYLLAHDDLLQALDDYSRSVGQTSVFPVEVAPAASPHTEKYYGPKDACNPSSNTQGGNVIQRNSIVITNGQCQSEERNNRLPRETHCEKRTESSKQQRGQGRLDSKEPRSAAAPRRSEKRKPRTYSQAIPSQHCHICSRRPTETSPHAVCGNLLKGRCRKTICTKCFHQFRWDLKAAREAPPGTWECPHCRGECPQRAQCVIYNRTSDRRRMKLINHRKKKDQTKVTGVGKYEMNSKASGKTQSPKHSPDSGTTRMNPFATSNSCSSSQPAAPPTNSSKSEKTSLQASGISKPVRASGMSSYAQFAHMADEMCDKIISETNAQNEWDGSGIITTAEMAPLEFGAKVVGFDQPHQLEMKSEVGFLGDNDLEATGRNESENVSGIFSYMGLPNEVLHVASGDINETEMGMIAGSGSEGLDTNLGLLEIEKSLERNKGNSESGQGRLSLWDDDEVKYEEMEVEEFPFNENRLDLDTIA